MPPAEAREGYQQHVEDHVAGTIGIGIRCGSATSPSRAAALVSAPFINRWLGRSIYLQVAHDATIMAMMIATTRMPGRASKQRHSLMNGVGSDAELGKGHSARPENLFQYLYRRLGRSADHGRMAGIAESWDRLAAPGATSRSTNSSASVRLQRLPPACPSGLRLVPILATCHGRSVLAMQVFGQIYTIHFECGPPCQKKRSRRRRKPN